MPHHSSAHLLCTYHAASPSQPPCLGVDTPPDISPILAPFHSLSHLAGRPCLHAADGGRQTPAVDVFPCIDPVGPSLPFIPPQPPAADPVRPVPYTRPPRISFSLPTPLMTTHQPALPLSSSTRPTPCHPDQDGTGYGCALETFLGEMPCIGYCKYIGKESGYCTDENVCICRGASASSTTGTSTTCTYTIKSGDTLKKIASRFGTTVSKLMQLNKYIKDPAVIYAGKKIKYPC